MSPKKLNPFKDFQSDQIQRSYRKIFTAHYACRNAALNLTPVTGTTGQYKTRTADCGLGIKYGLGIKRRLRTADCALGIKYGLRTTFVKTVLIGSR